MSRRFVVTAIEGHCDVTTFGDIGPRYIEVVVSAENAHGETIRYRTPIGEQPDVGEVVQFEEIPDNAVMTKEGP